MQRTSQPVAGLKEPRAGSGLYASNAPMDGSLRKRTIATASARAKAFDTLFKPILASSQIRRKSMRELLAGGCAGALHRLHRLEWLGPLLMRLFFGYFWLETGWAKLHNLDGFSARFVDWGIVFPAFSAGLCAGVECVGGALVMLGLLTRLTSISMIINMIVAIAVVVIRNVHSFDEFVELDEFVYILIFFWLLMAGAGKASLDAWLAHWLRTGNGALPLPV